LIVIGAPLGGVLADAAGYRQMLYAAAVGFGLVSAIPAISPYRHARLDDTARAIGQGGLYRMSTACACCRTHLPRRVH
jgi:predicted MFS family arabinose efflux permease